MIRFTRADGTAFGFAYSLLAWCELRLEVTASEKGRITLHFRDRTVTIDGDGLCQLFAATLEHRVVAIRTLDANEGWAAPQDHASNMPQVHGINVGPTDS